MSRKIELANKLSKKAETLELSASIIFGVTLVGSAILIIVGLIPTCPAGLVDCYDFERIQTWSLVITGLAVSLSAWWLYALSDVIAGRAQLAAEVAAPVAEVAAPAE
jgi:hypothetical protein